MNFDPNLLFYQMCKIFSDNYSEDNKVIICNEGGTRSSKTWDAFHFLITFCDHNRNEGNDIYILRDTLTNCRDYTFKDFKKFTKIIGLKAEFSSEGQKPNVKIFGNNLYFRGLDDEKNTEGYPSDVLFINEALETVKSKVDGLKMRCRKLIIMDWNPKYTVHWCFDLEKQPNVFFTHSTYKNNKHLERSIVAEIEAYNPWHPDDLELPKKQRRPHPVNIENNTADEFRWKVYGMGIRSAMKGLIFERVYYIDKFPDIPYTYGMDFGFTVDPLTLVRYAEDSANIYLELLCYEPIETPLEISGYMDKIGIERNIPITADSSDKHVSEKNGSIKMVHGLKELGWNIDKVRKTKNVMFWLNSMKLKKIHIIKDERKLYLEAKKEQENYRLKEINGMSINQPEDRFNHFWDGGRYSHMSHNENQELSTDWN